MKLHEELLELRAREKRLTSEILDKLQLMEDKRSYLKLGYSSLFDYLVRGLKYSESTAYQRQACVRLAKDIPEIKSKIDSGALSVSAVTTAFKHIKKKPKEEKRELLKKLENKSTREIKKIFTEPMRPIQIKRTHYQDKVYLRLELTHEQNRKLEQLKTLRSHKHSLESLLEHLIDKELKKYEVMKESPSSTQTLLKETRPNTRYREENAGSKDSFEFELDSKKQASKNPRYIPRRLRNDVLNSAHYKCQYPGCNETHFLQIDHIHPVRLGGQAKRENLQVLCGAHNRMKG